MKPLSKHEVSKLLKYNPETGIFTWLVNRSKVKAGDSAYGVWL